MKCIWFQLVVWILCTSLQCGATQLCDLTNNITGSFIPIDVNLTQTSCFRCPEVASSFTINDQIITSGAGINITSTTLMISDWSAYDISKTMQNILSCIQQSDGRTITTLFFTLTPGPLTLRQPVPTFFLENSSSNIDILCVNNNGRPGYNVQTQVWTDSDGIVVGDGRKLLLPQLRASAGTYTCGISSVPIIPVVMYDVVINKTKFIPVHPQSSQQDSIGLYSMINTNTLRQNPDAEDVDNFDSYDHIERKVKTSDKQQTSATYSMIEKEEIGGQILDDEIPDLYSVVNNNNGKETANSHMEVSELYAMVDKTRKHAKGNDNTMDLYAVVDKSKKKEQKLKELDRDLSEMYAVVDKTRKYKKEQDEDKDFNISDMYAVVDKSKRTDNRNEEEIPDISKTYSVVN